MTTLADVLLTIVIVTVVTMAVIAAVGVVIGATIRELEERRDTDRDDPDEQP